MAVISAERIMYKHAIELCQTAALDELFGNPQLCSQRLVYLSETCVKRLFEFLPCWGQCQQGVALRSGS